VHAQLLTVLVCRIADELKDTLTALVLTHAAALVVHDPF
jgi:hypothetical protein